MGHDSCENVMSGCSNRNRGASGQEQRARASLAQLLQRSSGTSYRGMQEHCMGTGMCTGHPTWPGCAGCPSALAPAATIRGRAGDPSCKGESRKRKAHRFPQPVTTKHELPSSRVYLSVCLSSLLGSAWQGRGRAWQVPPSTAAEPARHAAGDGSGARLAAGE